MIASAADFFWNNYWSFCIVIAIFLKCLYEVVSNNRLVLLTMAISSTTGPSPPAPICLSPSITCKRLSESPFLPPKRSKESSWGGFVDGGGERQEMETSPVGEENKVVGRLLRRRPSRIVIPPALMSAGFEEAEQVPVQKELAVEGDGYCLASKRGNKKVMEDGYGVITNINGDSKQAYFGVFDGHGGCAAVDFVSETLGKNIITALSEMENSGYPPEMAIRSGYLTTDKEFLTKNLGSGTCVATVLLKDGEIHAANTGDCKIVMSRSGSAQTLTTDHRAESKEERDRIENSGGYVNCRNGVWRVQGSLSISRAIGDLHMKEWIISEPETRTHRLTSDCDFLIIASDGLWDKVTDQEAVDVVLRHQGSIQSCKTLVDISSSRGRRDDITVMVVDLKRFASDG